MSSRYIIQSMKWDEKNFRTLLFKLNEKTGAIMVSDIVESSNEMKTISTIIENSKGKNIVGVKCRKSQNNSQKIGNGYMVVPEFLSLDELCRIIRIQDERLEKFLQTDAGRLEKWKEELDKLVISAKKSGISDDKIKLSLFHCEV